MRQTKQCYGTAGALVMTLVMITYLPIIFRPVSALDSPCVVIYNACFSNRKYLCTKFEVPSLTHSKKI